jgi:hypothetical protein
MLFGLSTPAFSQNNDEALPGKILFEATYPGYFCGSRNIGVGDNANTIFVINTKHGTFEHLVIFENDSYNEIAAKLQLGMLITFHIIWIEFYDDNAESMVKLPIITRISIKSEPKTDKCEPVQQ